MPSSWLGLVLFFLFVAPGLLFDLLADRRRALVKESAFREVGRTILASVAFGLAGLAVATGAYLLWPAVFADPLGLVGTGAGAYVTSSAQHVTASLGLQTVIAFCAVGVTHLVLRARTGARLEPTSAWYRVFRERLPGGHVPLARIRTKSGTVWVGVVHDYSPDLEVVDRELVLGPPLMSSREGRAPKVLSSDWQRVVLHHSEIESITVMYVIAPGTVPAAPSA